LTAPKIIREKKDESLDYLLEALNNLDISEEHMQVLEQAGTSIGSGGIGKPLERDPLGNQAYIYRVLAVLAETVASQQARISQLESKKTTKAA
jgi:hypothetical protein